MKKTFILTVTAFALTVSSGAQATGRTGEEVYNGPCKTCHAAGVAGAPKYGDKEAWATRIATGMEALMATVNTGRGAMPPKGTCMDCSADELKAAVEYMTAAAK
jgi:cytochrome c5